MTTMNASVDKQVAGRIWAVVPSQHPSTLAVPVYKVFSQTNQFETAVTPIDRSGENDHLQGRALQGFYARTSVQLLVATALPDVPAAVIDNIEAYLTHKRMVPAVEADAMRPMDIHAGMLDFGDREVPAVLVAATRNQYGVIALHRSHNAVRMVPTWIAPQRFRQAPDRFARQCEHLTHEHFLEGLASTAPKLAVEGLAMLMQSETRALPNQIFGAMLHKIRSTLASSHPVQQRIGFLLERIEVAEGALTPASYQACTQSLANLRQLLVVLAKARTETRVDDFDRFANLQSWKALMDAITQTTAELCGAMDGEAPLPRSIAANGLRQAAKGAEDDFARAMPSPQGCFAAGIANCALVKTPLNLGERTVAARFAVAARLVGESGWILARPYEHGILATLMGGW